MGDRRLIGKVHATVGVGLVMLLASNSWIPSEDAAFFSSTSKGATCEISSLLDTSKSNVSPPTAQNRTSASMDPWDPEHLPTPPLVEEHSILYIHVGKTGGITLDKVLQSNCQWYEAEFKRRQCLQQQHSSSTLSSLTKATLHFGPRQDYNEWIHNATMFLITLRNPISRVVSAFNFDHPINNPLFLARKLPSSTRHFFVECFPTIQHMAELLDLAEKQNNHMSRKQRGCYETATQVLAGTLSSDPAPQLRMNLQFYNRLTMALYPDRPVLVIRTEYLWGDVVRIDRALGGRGNFDTVGAAYTHGSQLHSVRQGLSPSGKQIICCYLWREVQLYEQIVQKAVNLSPTEKDETMAAVYSQCGVGDQNFSSWQGWAQRSCPHSTNCN